MKPSATANGAKRAIQSRILDRAIPDLSGRFGRITAMCMPGRSAWDARYLLEQSDVANIVAVERDPIVLASLRERFSAESRVRVVGAETTEFLEQAVDPIHLAYLDYFGWLGITARTDLRLLLSHGKLARGGIVAVAFLAAREPTSALVSMRLDLADATRKCGQLEIEGPIALRQASFLSELRRILGYYDLFDPPDWFSYQTNSGASMLTAVFDFSERSERSLDTPASHRSWFAIPEPKTMKASPKNLERMDPGSVRRLAEERIAAFIAKHGRVPSKTEAGLSGATAELLGGTWLSFLLEKGIQPPDPRIAIREGIDRARRSGKHFGRPRAVLDLITARLGIEQGKSIRAVARELGTNHATLARALRRNAHAS